MVFRGRQIRQDLTRYIRLCGSPVFCPGPGVFVLSYQREWGRGSELEFRSTVPVGPTLLARSLPTPNPLPKVQRLFSKDVL